MKALTTQVITMQTFFSVQSALLPVEPVYKLLVKARSYQPVSTALNTHLYCYAHCFTICIYGLVSTSSYQVLIYPQACTANPAVLRCICEDKVTCPPSLSQITAHPLTVQNITRFGCKSTWIPPSGRLLFPILQLLFWPWRVWSLLFARKMIAGGVVVLQIKFLMAFPKKQIQSAVRSKYPGQELTLSHCTRYRPAALNQKLIPRVHCEDTTGSHVDYLRYSLVAEISKVLCGKLCSCLSAWFANDNRFFLFLSLFKRFV